MTVALAKRPDDIIVITDDQIDLIKKTVAQNASPQELQLYFYDCQRRGVHPLDKLIHFTKRGGKYTPIVSIDYMRSQAAETGEYAGNDDAVFVGEQKTDSFAATLTVYRIVKGIRCAFTATARWSEYNSDSSPMYKKMPHTMLAKCAESLALRKAFPQQIQGLYTKEEMEQANDEPQMRNVTPTPSQPQQQAKVLSLPPQTVATSAEDCEVTGKQTLTPQELAQRLVDINAVTRTPDGYSIVAGTGTHLVQKINGKVGCNCEGFVNSVDPDYQCEHIFAAFEYATRQRDLDAKAALEGAR